MLYTLNWKAVEAQSWTPPAEVDRCPSQWGEKVYYISSPGSTYAMCMNGRELSDFTIIVSKLGSTLTSEGVNNLQQAYQYYQKNTDLFTNGSSASHPEKVKSEGDLALWGNIWIAKDDYWCLFLYKGQPIAAWQYSIAVANGTPPC